MGWEISSFGNSTLQDGVVAMMSGSASVSNWQLDEQQVDTSAKCSAQR